MLSGELVLMEEAKSKQKILIADDSEMNRSILTDMLGEEFDIIEAADGLEAIEQIEKYDDKISLVLLDIVMPNLDGFGVLAKMNEKNWIQDIPVIIILPKTRRRLWNAGTSWARRTIFSVRLIRWWFVGVRLIQLCSTANKRR